jgi:hypothetical protein
MHLRAFGELRNAWLWAKPHADTEYYHGLCICFKTDEFLQSLVRPVALDLEGAQTLDASASWAIWVEDLPHMCV